MPTLAEVMKDVRTEATTPVWPHYGVLFRCGRNASYDRAKEGLAEGDPLFVRSGKLVRMVNAVLRERLGIK
jgi:hypothetical protein